MIVIISDPILNALVDSAITENLISLRRKKARNAEGKILRPATRSMLTRTNRAEQGKGMQGGKNRRRGKNENDYAQVVKMLGNGRLEAQCFDGEKRLAHIRGKMRKKVSLIFPTISGSGGSTIEKVWINQGDIILLSLREFQDDKADVIVKYTADEARNLKAYGELPDTVKINETDTFGEEDGECTFEFGDEGEVDVDDI
ncbi:eIF-1a domain-containing protein [Rhizoctonia solani AG-1 IA]|uniref:Eukaryotic translation initiation factor 4C n=1 Tax=Thanatephorus cucumeris (strain AG1-IA) TaxID=983506 RepID=L8WIM8_THACA|nr:eIF-1a domain-containing protein [Rhizoctonia solani AG-1 IA]